MLQITSSVMESRSPQTTQSRGDIRSNRRVQKLILILFEFFFVDIAHIETLADDVEGEASA